MGLGTLLERTWTGIAARVRPPSAAALFRQADRYRNEGWYEEAADLVARGLEQAPQSRLGHLLSAYLHAARRQIEPAKLAFSRVLTMDPYHPRALLGLARVAIEEGDLDGSRDLLNRALQCYSDFPEALALRKLVESWSSAPIPVAESAPLTSCDVELGVSARDFLISREDGSLVSSCITGECATPVAEHTTRVCRMASATLSRAGLGPLRRGVVETQAGRTLLVSEAGLTLSATFDPDVDTGAGVAQLERMRTQLALDA